MARTLERQEAKPAEGSPATVAAPSEASRGQAGAAARYLVIAASVVIVLAGIKAAAALLVPFLVAVFIAVILAPLFLDMQRRGMPSGLALLLLVAVLVGGVLVALGVLERALAGFPASLQRYQASLAAQGAQLVSWLVSQGLVAPDSKISDYFSLQVLIGHIGPIAGKLGDLLVTTFIVLIVAIFILLEAAAMPAKVRALPGLSHDTWERIRRIVADVRRYMLLKTVMSLLTGALVAAFLFVLGVDFPILLGVLAFALNYIPNIGSTAAAIPGILLALVEFGPGTALLTGVGYVIINVGVSNGLEPRFMGYGLGLSPLVVLTSVIFWGWVLGPLGMLLSVPLTMTLKIVLESDDDTRWLALLMSGRPPKRLPAIKARQGRNRDAGRGGRAG